ncbi:MAG: hypothetical protein ABSH04_03405 [Acidimicrobiales bacterium]|jgi:uncharacterized membrane protein
MFHHGSDGSYPVFGVLLLVLLVALVVLGVIALVRMWSSPRGRPTPFQMGTLPDPAIDPALTELRVRYARGDISWDEYSRRARNLGYPYSPEAGPGGSASGGQAPPPAP